MAVQDVFANQRQVWRDYKWFYPLVAGFLVLGIGIFIGHFLIDGQILDTSDYGVNLYTEIVSIIATVLILDRLADRRRKREQVEELKQRLVRDAGSTVNDVAVKAIEELRAYGWLTGDDSLLTTADMNGADLSQADLRFTNLARCLLNGTNLSGANLWL